MSGLFISFLLPFVDRGAGPLFRWVMLAQMARLGPDELAFIGDARYFDEQDVPFDSELSVSGVVFTVPSLARFRQYRQYVLDGALGEIVAPAGTSHLEVFHDLLTQEVPALIEALGNATASLTGGEVPAAFLTWCNCPSLRRVASDLGVPVVHNELGALRSPTYRNTVYFDFLGVNGGSSPVAWMPEFLTAQMAEADLLPEPELRRMLAAVGGPGDGGARIGVALQVEDDSNIVAYSDGWDALGLIYHASARHPGRALLVRGHPHARFAYRGGLGARDESPDSIVFLGQLERLYAINSSLLAEALFWGVPFEAVGDCPVRPFALGGSLAPLAASQRDLVLNAFFLGYLVPAGLLFSPEYYRWRLEESRTLGECHARHLAYLRMLDRPDLTNIDHPPPQQEAMEPQPPVPLQAGESWLENQRVDRKLARLEAEVARLTATQDVLLQEVVQRDQSIADIRSYLEQRELAVQWLESQRSGLARELDASQAVVTQLREHLEEREQSVQWLESHRSGLARELDASQAVVTQLREHLEEREQSVQWLESQRSGLAREFDASQAVVMQLREHLEQRDQAVQWLESQRTGLARELDASQAVVSQLREYLDDREQAVQWLEQQRKNLEQEVSARGSAIAELNAHLANRVEAIDWLEQKLGRCEAEIARLERMAAVEAARADDLRVEMQRYRTQPWVRRLERLGLAERKEENKP